MSQASRQLFSFIHRHQFDPQGETQEAKERDGSLLKGMVGQSDVSHLLQHQFISSCCAAVELVAVVVLQKASIQLQWRKRELPETLFIDKMCFNNLFLNIAKKFLG